MIGKGSSYHAITAEFMAMYRDAGVPAGYLIRVESYLITALEPAERERRAAELMPKHGATLAASRLGVCRKTVYNRAARHAKKCKAS